MMLLMDHSMVSDQREERRKSMCEHKRSKATKKKVVINLLCRKCVAQENFDRKELAKLRKGAYR